MVRGKAADRTSGTSALLAGLLVATFIATPAWAEKIHGKLRGAVDVPGTNLTLPLPPGAPRVIATLFLGGPGGPAVPFTITPNTKVDAEDAKEKASGNVITITDGDSIEVRGRSQIGEIVATTIELENPEIKIFGIVDVPGMSLTLPLAAGAPSVTITLFLGGVGGPPLDIIVTPNTRIRGETTLTLFENDFIEVKAVFQGGQVVALKTGKENQTEVEDE